jgi:two-component system cell cycle response regulator DivK
MQNAGSGRGRDRRSSDQESESSSSVRASPRPAKCVLLVDDSADTRTMYSLYFQFRGLRVTTAIDGMEALQTLDIKLPDVIVIDLAMPRITGWDVIRELKGNPRTRHVPILALSGQGTRASAMMAGADAYQAKPCTPEDLLREVVRLLHEDPPESN